MQMGNLRFRARQPSAISFQPSAKTPSLRSRMLGKQYRENKSAVGIDDSSCRALADGLKLIADSSKKPTRGAVFSGPSMNPSYTVGTLRSSLGISA